MKLIVKKLKKDVNKNKKISSKLLSDNDPSTFAELYDRFAPHIYRFIYFKVNSKQDAQDLTSECFLKVWSAMMEKKDVMRNFRAFAYKVARNLVIDFYRQKRQNISLDEVHEDVVVTLPDVERLIHNEDTARILKALKNMKEEYREIIMFRYLDEMSYKEIAEVVEKSQIHIRVLAHRGIQMLKNIIKQQ